LLEHGGWRSVYRYRSRALHQMEAYGFRVPTDYTLLPDRYSVVFEAVAERYESSS